MATTLICMGFLVAVLGVRLWQVARPRETALASAERRRHGAVAGSSADASGERAQASRSLGTFMAVSGWFVACGFAAWIGAWCLPQMILEDQPFWGWTWIGGLVLVGVPYVSWTAWRLGSSAHRGLVFAIALLFGVPGCVGMVGIAITAVDVLADRSEPQLIDGGKASIRAAVISRKGGRWKEYFVTFESNDSRLRARTTLEIDESTYRKLLAKWNGLEGEHLVVAWHPGVLGMPWVEVWN